MFHYYHDFSEALCAARPIETTRELHPGLMDFRQWLARYAVDVPVPRVAAV